MGNEYLSNLLISEPPLQCMPSLAVAFHSSDEAIILQQIHYWLLRSKQVKDGHKWVYNSMKNWQKQFPWIKSTKTLTKYFKDLEKRGLLITANYNRAGFDKTKWYRIDYAALSDLGKRLSKGYPTDGQELPNGLSKGYPIQEDNFTQPIPIDYTENNNRLLHEITSSSSPHSPNGATRDDDDEKRTKILSQLLRISRLNDDVTGKVTQPSLKQLKVLQAQVKNTPISLLNDVKASFELQMKSGAVMKPISYLITLLNEAIKTEKEWKK